MSLGEEGVAEDTRPPDPADEPGLTEEKLDEGVADSFPASDPPSYSNPVDTL